MSICQGNKFSALVETTKFIYLQNFLAVQYYLYMYIELELEDHPILPSFWNAFPNPADSLNFNHTIRCLKGILGTSKHFK